MSVMCKLSLSVQYAISAQNIPARHQFRRWIKAALQHDAQITLRIVGESEGRELNRDYRGKDYATNVLTFVYGDTEPTPQPPLSGGLTGSSHDKWRLGGAAVPPLYGDIAICAPVVEKEAREQNKNLPAHYAHLAIHAALHLQGYGHDNDADAAVMEARETALLVKLGYADSYTGR